MYKNAGIPYHCYEAFFTIYPKGSINMLHELRRASDVISLEAQQGDLSKATGRLPDFFTGLKTAFNEYLAKPLSTFFSRHDINWFSREVQKAQYVGLREVEVVTPPGLKVDFLTYAEKLIAGTKAMLTLKQDVLVPFNSWLGAKLGNPSALNALTGNLNIAGLKPHDVEKLHADILACFQDHGKLEVLSTYGNVIKRNGDWNALSKHVADLLNAFSDAHHKEIVALVNQATNLMDQLQRRIEEEPETYKLSPTTLQGLANTAYILGQQVEFYGLLRHRVDEFGHALDQNVNKLETFVR